MKLITTSNLKKYDEIVKGKYATIDNVDAGLASKSDKSHTHDDRYFTEAEMTTKLAGKSDTGHKHTATEVGARPASWVPAWGDVTSKPSTFAPTLGTTSNTAFRGDYGNVAYTHSQENHAPVNAQKNSDITKSEIETKLTGDLTTHTHDSRYYTEAETDSMLAGKANVSHGNHVPGTQPVNNAVFLRNDNSWATVTPANIGAKAASWVPAWGDVTGKPSTFTPTLGTTSSTAFRGDYGNIAYTHSQAAHAPSNAQKNSDITKAEIEAKLTGAITTHTHDGRYYTKAEVDTSNTTINSAITSGDAATLNSAKSYTNTALADLVGGAPEAMDTLKELADAIAAHEDVYQSYIETVSTELAGKANKVHTHVASEVGARPSNWVPAWGDVTSKPSTFAPTIGTTSTTAFRGDYGNIAYNHSQAAHAPSNAQKNSDITKAEIEAKLTGDLTTHTHDGRYYTESEVDTKLNTKAHVTHRHASNEVDMIKLPASCDLDKYYDSGKYISDSDGNSTTILNRPPGTVGFALEVYCVYGSGVAGRTIQIAYVRDNKTYIRNKAENAAWTAWDLQYSASNKPTAADIGAKAASWVPAWGDVTGKPSTFAPVIGTTSTTAFRGDYGNTAYTHSQAAHAPTNAQKNSDITKAEIEAKLTGSITTHNHDGSYYTEAEIDTKLNGKANSSHGNHVPATQTANNTVFLRNDNTWATVTAANIGAKAASWVPSWGEVTGKPSFLALGTTSTTAFRGDYGNIAYTHSQSAHAPTNAQKNSDITKAEIEAKLTGAITTHTHASVNGCTFTVEGGEIYITY